MCNEVSTDANYTFIVTDNRTLVANFVSPQPFLLMQGFVTDPGAMENGADASWLKGSQSTWGPNINWASSYKIGDDFSIETTTTINEIEVYGYQTGSEPVSSFTGLYVVIYDGNPMTGGQIIWGDYNENIMTNTSFTNCYRGSNGEVSAMTRPIMSITATGLNIQLQPGEYYLVWGLTGSLQSGPWGQPHCEPEIGNLGNGIQYQPNNGWAYLTDSGSSEPYGMAFKLTGFSMR